jgi:hypothetical protein
MLKLTKLLKNTAKKTTKGLGEYFLGTQTINNYKRHKAFLREYITDEKQLKKQLSDSKISQYINLFFGKAVPAISDSLILSYSLLVDSDVSWTLLTLTELYRAGWAFRIYKFRKQEELSTQLIINASKRRDSLDRTIKNQKDFLDKIIKTTDNLFEELEKNDDEGEEWKRGTEYEDN